MWTNSFSLRRRHPSLAPPRRHDFLGPFPPQLLPCGPRAGAADVADRGGQASGAARRVNSSESPALALPCWEHSCSRVLGPFTFCERLPASSRLAYSFAPLPLRLPFLPPSLCLSALGPAREKGVPVCAGLWVTASECTRVDPRLYL